MIFLALIAALCLPPAVACGGDDDAPASPAATQAGATTAPANPVRPAKLTDVTLGYIPILIDAPFFVGIEKGYFADEGINLKLERLAGGADMLVQTASGNFDIGGGGIGAAVFNAAGAAIKDKREVPFEIVLPLHSEKPPVVTPLVVSKARFDSGEITKVADLKGKKVAINARGASTEYWLDRALASGGLTYKDVTVVAVPFNDVPEALVNKSIDASMLGEPIATQAEDQGKVRVLTEDFVNGEQPTGVYWNRAWSKKNPELAAGFIRAYLRAVRDLENGGWQDPAVLAILEKYTQVPANTIKRASRPYNDVNGVINQASFKRQEAFFRSIGLLTYDGELDFALFMRTK
jgi:NitT/TauT family transport system substrate-binding protein